MSILGRIKVLREANGNISINKLEKEAGLSRGSMSKWDDHAPSYEKIKKVADYFKVPVSYLTGEEQQKKPTQAGELSEEERKFIEWFRSQASEKDKAILRTIVGDSD